MPGNTEIAACTPEPIDPNGFNRAAKIPFGVKPEHIRRAMQDFIDFLGFVNSQLNTKQIERLESFLMPANFSTMVGEFMAAAIPKYCKKVIRNKYHNGHPDLLPLGHYPGDSILHGPDGIEIKGSRHKSGWQGHNAEDCWLMVFVFDFSKVVGAKLVQSDWQFSGRSETSRRTITASVKRSGFDKMEANWIYRA
jgi:hypothetical protein